MSSKLRSLEQQAGFDDVEVEEVRKVLDSHGEELSNNDSSYIYWSLNEEKWHVESFSVQVLTAKRLRQAFNFHQTWHRNSVMRI